MVSHLLFSLERGSCGVSGLSPGFNFDAGTH